MDEQMTTHGQTTTQGEQAQLPPTTDFSHRKSKCHVAVSDVAIFVHQQCGNATTTLRMTKWTMTIHHSLQMMVSKHKQKQTTRNQGQQACLPPPLTSLIQNPGAMSLWVTWQPNDKQ